MDSSQADVGWTSGQTEISEKEKAESPPRREEAAWAVWRDEVTSHVPAVYENKWVNLELVGQAQPKTEISQLIISLHVAICELVAQR